RVAGVPVIISPARQVWALGVAAMIQGELGGFAIDGVPNHSIWIEELSSRIASGLLAIKKAVRPDFAPDNLFTPWDPVYKTIIERVFPETSEAAIGQALARETTIHELLHRWFEFRALDRASS